MPYHWGLNRQAKPLRGRQFGCGRLYGEEHPRAKLTWAKVAVMRQARADGWSVSQIARQFGLPRATVRDAVQMNTWTVRP